MDQQSFQGQKERPAYIRFETRAVEDREAMVKSGSGSYVGKNVDFVLITPVGSKDEVVKIASEWFAQLKQYSREGRLPPDHELHYQKIYEAWKRGEETPLYGTPIKDWPPLSPAQRQQVLAANVRTVEDLSSANGEALQRIGMGAREMKQKAEAWCKASTEIGAVVQENSMLKTDKARLEQTVKEQAETLQTLVAERDALKAQLPVKKAA